MSDDPTNWATYQNSATYQGYLAIYNSQQAQISAAIASSHSAAAPSPIVAQSAPSTPDAATVTPGSSAVSNNAGAVASATASPNYVPNSGLSSYAPISIPSIGVRIREFIGGLSGGQSQVNPRLY